MAPSRTPTGRDATPAVSAPTVELPMSKIPAVARAKSRSVAKPTSSPPIKAIVARPSASGGTYSMTKAPPLRASTSTPAPVDDTITVEIAGRMVKLARRDARILVDKLLRALK